MRKTNRTIDYYSAHADRFCQTYERYPFENIHSHWLHLISPHKKIRMLDVGAGSGRDASWFAQRGHEVIAVEPSDGLRDLARDKHSGIPIRWVKDCLPGLRNVKRLKLRFDLILLNAVWMHIAEKHREKAFCNLVHLLREKGTLVIALRYGPSHDGRIMHPVCKEELVGFAEATKSKLILDKKSNDLFGRRNVSWETLAFRVQQVEGGTH